MKPENPLISRLVSDLRPQPWLSGARPRIVAWILFCTVYSVVLAAVCPGPPLWMIVDRTFVIETSAMFCAAVLSGVGGIVLSVPGERISKRAAAIWVALVAIIFMAILSVDPQAQAGITELTDHINDSVACSSGIVQFAIVPAAFGFWLIGRGAALDAGLSTFLVFLGGGLLGTTVLQFDCTNQQPLHLFVGHMLPAVIWGMIGIIAAKYFLSWRKRVLAKRRSLLPR